MTDDRSAGRSLDERSEEDRAADHAAIDDLAGGLLPALVAKLSATGLGEIEVREGAWKIRVRRPAGDGTTATKRGADRSADRPSRAQPGHAGHGHPPAGFEGHRSAREGRGPAAHSTNGSSPPSLVPVGPDRDPAADAASRDDARPGQAVATSPAVGVYQPRAEARQGTRVRSGDRLGAVDMLGIAQEVVAPADGLVGESLVEPGQAVEYGQELVVIDLAGGLTVFRKILIANRGEIALRILRACRTLGVEAVVAYSEADRDSLPVQLADEAICIGPADAKRSYLSAPAMISAAIVTGCDAIHPGYGFLSEDGGFAEVVRAHELVFIGPPAAVLERFASKEATRRLLASHGLPTIPGSNGILRDDAQALEEGERIGYPLLIKPAAGGGGKGMRMVRTPRELEASLNVCRSEARAAFGDDSLYLERWLDENRHVEVQVVVDRYGHGVHLGERDCSVQRRHQKILEEAPTPALSDAARADLCERAVRAVVAAGYENVGTLEFLVDNAGNYYFIEINCRIQVEHPVTEVLTGVDLVVTQIRVAAGEPIGFNQADIAFRGHAIEFRINAEDPERDFRPSAGVVERYLPPGGPGVRMDSHLYAGYEVPPYYDSLLGKLIVWGPTREVAIARSVVALDELLIEGIVTNVSIHKAMLASDTFLDGKMTTNLLDRVGGAAFLAAAARA